MSDKLRRYEVAPWYWFWGVKDNAIALSDGDDPQANRVWGSVSRSACVKTHAELNNKDRVQP